MRPGRMQELKMIRDIADIEHDKNIRLPPGTRSDVVAPDDAESLFRLPIELVEVILGKLGSFVDYLNFAMTCKSLYAMSKKPALWEQMCRKRWERRDTPLWLDLAPLKEWQQMYIKKHEVIVYLKSRLGLFGTETP